MQTATSWLAKQLEDYGEPHKLELTWEDLDSLVKQANEMFEQQTIKFTQDFIEKFTCGSYDGEVYQSKEISDYFNETYGSKGSDSSINSTLNSSSKTEISDDRTKLHWKTSLVVHTPKISDDEIEEAAEKGGFYDRVLSASPPPNTFTFSLKNNEPIIVLSEEGFKYKEELIEDAGEVYKLFKEFLIKANRPTEISDEEIEKFFNEELKSDEARMFAKGGAKWYREQLKKKQ